MCINSLCCFWKHSCRSKSLQTPANVFVANLAVADFLMMLSQGPFYILTVMRSKWWSFGVLGCEIYGFTGGLFGITAILSMAAIGLNVNFFAWQTVFHLMQLIMGTYTYIMLRNCITSELACLGLDRYLVITRGMSGPRIKMVHAVIIVGFIWAYALAVVLPPLLKVWSRFSPGSQT